MKSKKTLTYIAPVLELTHFAVEAGFAGTAPDIEDITYGDDFVW